MEGVINMAIDILSFVLGMIAWELIRTYVRSYIIPNIKNKKVKKQPNKSNDHAKPNSENKKVEITKENKESES